MRNHFVCVYVYNIYIVYRVFIDQPSPIALRELKFEKHTLHDPFVINTTGFNRIKSSPLQIKTVYTKNSKYSIKQYQYIKIHEIQSERVMAFPLPPQNLLCFDSRLINFPGNTAL